MNKLEEYFNNTAKFNNELYDKYDEYEYKNKELFKTLVDINLWANDISFKHEEDKRTKQEQFRKEIIARDEKCIVTQKFESIECEACHIIPVEYGGTYDINNGLLINSIHHKTFDKNLWCINPNDLSIDILTDDKKIVGSIFDYKGSIVNIKLNNIMKNYLKKRWEIYIKEKNAYKN
jgi:hypothetical protein